LATGAAVVVWAATGTLPLVWFGKTAVADAATAAYPVVRIGFVHH